MDMVLAWGRLTQARRKATLETSLLGLLITGVTVLNVDTLAIMSALSRYMRSLQVVLATCVKISWMEAERKFCHFIIA